MHKFRMANTSANVPQSFRRKIKKRKTQRRKSNKPPNKSLMYGIIPKQSREGSQGRIRGKSILHIICAPSQTQLRTLSFRRVLMFMPGNNSNNNNNIANLGQTINSWHLIKGENLLKASKGFVFPTQAKHLSRIYVCACVCVRVFNLLSSSHNSHSLSPVFYLNSGMATTAAVFINAVKCKSFCIFKMRVRCFA